MTVQQALAIYNFAPEDEQILMFLKDNFTHSETRLTIIHLYPSIPKVSQFNPALALITQKFGGLIKELGDKEERFQQIRSDLLNAGFKEGNLQMILKPRKDTLGKELANYIQNNPVKTIIMSLGGKKIRQFKENYQDYLLKNLKNKVFILLT